MAFTIVLPPRVRKVLAKLRAYDRSAILDSIQSELTEAPEVERGRTIRKLVQPAISQLRLRVGDFRVYYDVDDLAETVTVVMVARKGTQSTEEVTGDEGR